MNLKLGREIWKFLASEKIIDNKPHFLKILLEQGIVAFGEYGEGDLHNYSNIHAIEERLTQLRNVQNSHPTAKYYFQFRDEAEIGDIVIIYSRSKIFGIGYIKSDYYYRKDNLGTDLYPLGIPNRREVKWIYKEEIYDGRLEILKQPQLTFFKLDKEQRKTILKVLEDSDIELSE